MSVYAYDTVLDTKNNEKTILLLMITKVPLPPQWILKSRTPSRFNFVHVTQNIQNMFQTNQNLKMRVINKVKLFLKVIDIKQNCLIFIIFVQTKLLHEEIFPPRAHAYCMIWTGKHIPCSSCVHCSRYFKALFDRIWVLHKKIE